MNMATYTMLKGASNLFSPVVLQERAVLESGDVLENEVYEGIRLNVT